jgi:Tfp pilus assembly protein PilX
VLDLFLNAVRRRLGDECGMALPLALGVTVILSSLCAGIFSYVTSNQQSAHRATADQRAYGLAEAGLSYAFSTLQKADDASPYYAPPYDAVPETTVTYPDGRQFVYRGDLSGTMWTLYGTGTVPNPSGPDGAPVVRRVSAQALVTTTTTGDTRPYDYLFIDQPSGCFTLTNTVTLEVPLYVRGNLCLENNSFISSPAVHVIGDVHVNSPQASVGTEAAPIPDFSITGDCYREGNFTDCDATATSRVWASAYGDSPPELTKPTVDLPARYADADLGPMSGCTPGYGTENSPSQGFPGGFDNDTTMNVSLGTVDLTPSTAYDCQKVVAGETVAQLKWVPGSNPSQAGTLTIEGTIFIDGNLTWSNLSLIRYEGRGTIYVAGTLTIQNQAELCGVATCDETWDPEVNFLAFVVGSMTTTGTTEVSGEVGNKVNFQGAIYLVNDYDQDNNTTIWGPVIANNATITNSGLFKPLPGGELGTPPPGLPVDTVTVSEMQLIPGSYSG